MKSAAEEITPQWLTRTLNEAGFTGVVQEVTWQRIGAGQVGENARFFLSGKGDIPATVVGKFPSTDPTSKQTGVQLLNYARECWFYRDLNATVRVETPTVYGIEFDDETHDFVILMEDLAPGFQIDQMDAANVDQAKLALEQLAGLHGPRWADPTLREHPLAQPPPVADDDTPLYCMLQPDFVERYGARLSDAELKAVHVIGETHKIAKPYDGEETLIHVDYRLDNMIFGGPRPLTILDWQSINLGCAFQDVSYFMGTSLEPDIRKRHEQALLTFYLDALAKYDITISFEQAWHLYRRHAQAGLNMAVIASMIVGETDRGNDMFMTMAKRSITMCGDLETATLLLG